MPVRTPSKLPLALTSFRQIRALAHPLRFRAFEALIDAPRTGKQLAERFHKQPTHLYHHLRVLEGAGLVRPVATKKKRGTTEKYFRAVSNRVVIDEVLFRGKVAAHHALFAQILRLTLDELAEASVSASTSLSPQLMLIKRLRIRASPARIKQLGRELQAWLDRFESADAAGAEGGFAVTVAFYPIQEDSPTDVTARRRSRR